MHRHYRQAQPVTGGLLTWAFIVWAVLIGMICASKAHADTPVLHRHDGPPEYEKSCQVQLDQIKGRMLLSSMAEAHLAKRIGDTESYKYYRMRASAVTHTPEFHLSAENCTKANITTLDALAARWWYDFVLDEVHVDGQEK